ncbi:hypothetical protein SLA2020_453500 [Shorea laevis]
MRVGVGEGVFTSAARKHKERVTEKTTRGEATGGRGRDTGKRGSTGGKEEGAGGGKERRPQILRRERGNSGSYKGRRKGTPEERTHLEESRGNKSGQEVAQMGNMYSGVNADNSRGIGNNTDHGDNCSIEKVRSRMRDEN